MKMGFVAKWKWGWLQNRWFSDNTSMKGVFFFFWWGVLFGESKKSVRFRGRLGFLLSRFVGEARRSAARCYVFLFLLSSTDLILLSFLSLINTASTRQLHFCYLSYQLPLIYDSSFQTCINTISSYFETVARFCWIKSYLNLNFLKPARQTSWRTRILVWLKNTTNDCRQRDYSGWKS